MAYEVPVLLFPADVGGDAGMLLADNDVPDLVVVRTMIAYDGLGSFMYLNLIPGEAHSAERLDEGFLVGHFRLELVEM
jgi:hypothetical protein